MGLFTVLNTFLIKCFVRNYEDAASPEVRTACGVLCGWFGIMTNLALFVAKLSIGILSGSVAVMADAVNNLSDLGSALITLIGFKLSGKPPDHEHPFGHGRLEYVAGLIVAVIIIAVGLNFLKLSVERIVSPTGVRLSGAAFAVLLAALPVKLWMFFFYRKVARKIASPALDAAAFDSLSDILTTSLVIASLAASYFTTFPVDGVAGVAVAVFVIAGGIKVVREIVDPLLGSRPDRRLVEEMCRRLQSCRGICGVHDIMIHNYGPARYFATAHAEVNPEADPISIHDFLEAAEVEIARTMPIRLLLHCDPFSSHDPELKKWRVKAENAIAALDQELRVYDFRLESAAGGAKIRFNLLVPHAYGVVRQRALVEKICQLLRRDDAGLDVEITIAHSYV